MNLNPLPNNLRVRETEVAELAQYGDTAHSLPPLIANSDSGNSTTNSFNCQTKNKGGHKPPRKFK